MLSTRIEVAPSYSLNLIVYSFDPLSCGILSNGKIVPSDFFINKTLSSENGNLSSFGGSGGRVVSDWSLLIITSWNWILPANGNSGPVGLLFHAIVTSSTGTVVTLNSTANPDDS